MTTMKNAAALLSTLILLAGGASASQEQPGPGAPPGPGMKQGRGPLQRADAARRLANLDRMLKLSDEQKNKIKPLLQDAEEQVKTLQGDPALTRDQKIKRLQEIRLKNHDRIRQLLTPPQQEQFDKAREKARERREERRKQRSERRLQG